jgi:hypothetical protein
MKSNFFLLFFYVSFLIVISLTSKVTRAASVFFVEPVDGAIVKSPFNIKFGIIGMKVRPAGDMTRGTGHHHLLINKGVIPIGRAIPMDSSHLHFGKGQVEASIFLPPGTYRLTMQFGNGVHQSYGSKLSKTISVTVR